MYKCCIFTFVVFQFCCYFLLWVPLRRKTLFVVFFSATCQIWWRFPWSLLFSTLNRLISLSVSSDARCPYPLNIFMALLVSSCLLCGAQNGPPDVPLHCQVEGKNHIPLVFLRTPQGCSCPSLPQGHMAGSNSSCPTGLPRLFLQYGISLEWEIQALKYFKTCHDGILCTCQCIIKSLSSSPSNLLLQLCLF